MRIFCARALLSFCSVPARQRINSIPNRRKGVRENPANRVFPNKPKNIFTMFKFKLSNCFKSASVRTEEPTKGSDAVNFFNMKHCVPTSDPSQLHPVLIEKLLVAQRLAGFQFMITSAFRSKAHELAKGRNGSSSHCKYDANENPSSLAVDISAIDSHTRYKVLGACLLAGFPRIGIGKSFIHVDIDEAKAHPVVFHYYE